MKTLTFLICSILAISIQASSQPFSLKGRFTDYKVGAAIKVFLLKIDHLDQLFLGNIMTVVDSSTVDKKGNFSFSNVAVIEDNTFYRVNVVDTEQVGPGAIMMVGTHENFTFFLLNRHSQIAFLTNTEQVGVQLNLTKSDKVQHLIRQFAVIRKPCNEQVDVLVKRRNALNQDAPYYKDSVKAIFTEMEKAEVATRFYDNIRDFADTVSNPYVSLLAMQYLPANDYHEAHMAMNERYQQQIPSSKYAEQYNAILKGETTYLKPGSKAPEFRMPDNNTKMVALSDFEGKYVLVDFWASWCPPCRVENVMYIKPLYNNYKDKGFTVVSISQDVNKANWLTAINNDEVNIWHHLSDLKGQASKTVNDYKVTELPYNYLVDPGGIIIAQNLRGPELEAFIKKTIK
ncbi:MAG: TlpA family protein disulfide reductase [Taibaiella sp.]|nr:TlpA family protein disulfide reductase [Taibaiella sp.]